MFFSKWSNRFYTLHEIVVSKHHAELGYLGPVLQPVCENELKLALKAFDKTSQYKLLWGLLLKLPDIQLHEARVSAVLRVYQDLVELPRAL